MAEYEVSAQVPTVDDYICIRQAAALSRKTEEAATIGLKNSLFAVTVFCEGVPVGIGRVIGNGGCFYEKFGFTKAKLPKAAGMFLRIP